MKIISFILIVVIELTCGLLHIATRRIVRAQENDIFELSSELSIYEVKDSSPSATTSTTATVDVSADSESPVITPTRTIEVNGSPVTLDEYGPIVLNKDGTARRITNWNQMNIIEKETALRVIADRNKRRIAQLKQTNR